MKPIRVLLVDDHRLVRAGLRSLVEANTHVTVVGEADNGEEALALLEKIQPDVVVMDLSMDGINGLEATRRLLKIHPNVRVLMLSMYASQEYVLDAFKAGAMGYLLKRAAGRDLVEAIETVAQSREYRSPELIHSNEQKEGARALSDPLGLLTQRQREILRLICQSLTTKQIAARLNLSAKTVEFHRAQLMRRLQVHDIPGLVRLAVWAGLVPPEPDAGKA